MKKAIFLITVFLLAFSVCSSPSIIGATMVKTLSEDDMVNKAEKIIIGTCKSVRSEWNPEGTKIVTYITIIPKDSLKSDETAEEIIIKQPGGEVGEVGMIVHGTSVFEQGEEVFLFLKRGSQQVHRVVGLSQGKYSIKADPISGRKTLIKKSRRLVKQNGQITKKIMEIRSDKTLYLDDFRNRIQNILNQKQNPGSK